MYQVTPQTREEQNRSGTYIIILLPETDRQADRKTNIQTDRYRQTYR